MSFIICFSADMPASEEQVLDLVFCHLDFIVTVTGIMRKPEDQCVSLTQEIARRTSWR